MYQAKRKSVIEREKRENRKEWEKSFAIAGVTIPVLWILTIIFLV